MDAREREEVRRRYTVKQEREVSVTAVGPAEAIAFADSIFSNRQTPGDSHGPNSIVTPMRVTDISAHEDF